MYLGAADDQDCSPELQSYKRLLLEVQGIVNFGSVNAADLPAEQLQQFGLDDAALESQGCKLQLVLFPWGAKKTLRAKYQRWELSAHC